MFPRFRKDCVRFFIGTTVGCLLLLTLAGCPAPQRTLTATVTGNGSVTLSPAGGTYADGTSVLLTPAPATGWHFDHWAGDLSGNTSPGQLTIDAAKTVTAVFVQDQYTLIVLLSGSGTATMDPPGGTYLSGTTVTVTPYAAPGWHFDHWEGELSGNTTPAQLTMDAAKTVTAVFVQESYPLNVTAVGNGTVTLNPPGGTYLSETVVTLTPVPAVGWHFDHWTGDLAGNTNPEPLTMSAAKAVSAVFVQDIYALTVVIVGNGTVTLDQPGGNYLSGSTAILTAHPAVGWHFDHWAGDLAGTFSPNQITMDAPKTVTAAFVQDIYTLNVTVTGNGNVALNPPGGSYLSGTVVTLTTTADPGNRFDIWEGDLAGNTSSLNMTMDRNKSVQAFFASRAQLSFSPTELCAKGSTVFFSAYSPYSGRELWKSDGTLAGTDLVKDMVPGDKDSEIRFTFLINGDIYFFCLTDSSGFWLWKSDGTEAGTAKVVSLGGSFPEQNPVNVGGVMYWSAMGADGIGELWKTDGTEAGTVILKRFGPTYVPDKLAAVGGFLYFNILDQSSPQIMSLWKSDGTVAGTVSILTGYYFGEIVDLGGEALFPADYSLLPQKQSLSLWKTNGTLAGTSRITSFSATAAWALGDLTVSGGMAYFSAWPDGSLVLNSQVWKSDGTDISIADNTSYRPWGFIDVSGTLFYNALYEDSESQTHAGLFTIAAGISSLIKVINPTHFYGLSDKQANVGGTLFFDAENASAGSGLWKSDGTTAGTVLLSGLVAPAPTAPDLLTNVAGTLYCQAYDNVRGYQLWKSDGTDAGTVAVSWP